MAYLRRAVDPSLIPQLEALEGQVKNNAGGYVFPVDDWTRLLRFLILGSEGNTYYQTERDLTSENVDAVKRCIVEDGMRVLRLIEDVSVNNRAPKNDPALFVLALCLTHGDAEVKRHAALTLPAIARTGTHLLHFAAFADGMRGWGKALRFAIGNWYLAQPAKRLAYQVLKYQQRDGWSHRDLLRLSHPKAEGLTQEVLHWVVKGWPSVGEAPHDEPALQQIWAAEYVKRLAAPENAMAKKRLLLITDLIKEYKLPREAVPTELLNERVVLEAMLEDMPIGALLRNLGNLTAKGVISPMSPWVDRVCMKLTDAALLKAGRIHPIAVLAARMVYAGGKGIKGSQTWTPVPQIVAALERAFDLSFGAIEPMGKRILIGMDVSGSMGSGEVAGVPGLTPYLAAHALALSFVKTEPEVLVCAFHDQFLITGMHSGMSLAEAMACTGRWASGSTDCALPMLGALQTQVPIDLFLVITDNETWAGKVHPTMALQLYRKHMQIPAKLAVIAMTSTGFSIADPADAGQMDVVGFDTAVPGLLREFMVGGIADNGKAAAVGS